ncbi:MAG: hypothetical protein GY909_19005 [Oligoflexia bacterium]|nr:hypothetical protein [Oligoflexia bacterium]
MKNASKAKSSKGKKPSYETFDEINGTHPLQEKTLNSHVLYPARIREGGNVSVFNFALAKEIGLIPEDHPEVLDSKLEKKILETFGIIIINEYDQINDIKFDEKTIKPHKYMATRYLQLQHPNKQGKTSGDGRSVWNGQYKGNGKVWDISSCGTGATCLSPATHTQNKFFQSGDPSISYGCGYAEVEEGYASLFFSEVLNKNNLKTERVLAVLQFEKNYGITVRVHENLLRPSHMFNHLKQGNHEALKAMVDFYIDRQVQNKEWKNVPKSGKARYEYFAQKQCEVFAKTAANFEDEYIFCWMDWDGDNILMDGGIIDYGSVRQFGLFHSEYRFDDVDRFSTNIIEQKQKARYTVQTFIQLVDFINTKKRKTVGKFNKDKLLNEFEDIFQEQKNINLLKKIGFSKKHREAIYPKYKKEVEKFRKVFSYFERSKSIVGLEEVNDGINWNAIFCMRDILRELPQLYLSRALEDIKHEEFIEIIKSNYALTEDLELSSYRKSQINKFQRIYKELVSLCAKELGMNEDRVILEIMMRSSVINKFDRVTGDSITTIVDLIMKNKKSLTPDKMHQLLKNFVDYQNLNPESKFNQKRSPNRSKMIKDIYKIVSDYREGL